MKVLELGPYPPPYGGIQTHLVALVEGLRKRGTSCEVMNLTRFRRPSRDGIFYPSNSLSVLLRLLLHRYDIIHLHIGGRIWPRQLVLGLLISALPGTRSVLTLHSGASAASLPSMRRSQRCFAASEFPSLEFGWFVPTFPSIVLPTKARSPNLFRSLLRAIIR